MTGAPTSGALCWVRRSGASSGVWIAEAQLRRPHRPHRRSRSRPLLWSRPQLRRRVSRKMLWKRRQKKENRPRVMGEDDVARARARARVRANGPRESVGGDGKHATLRRLTRLSEIKCVCEHFYNFTTHSVLVLAFYSTHVSRTSSTIFERTHVSGMLSGKLNSGLFKHGVQCQPKSLKRTNGQSQDRSMPAQRCWSAGRGPERRGRGERSGAWGGVIGGPRRTRDRT